MEFKKHATHVYLSRRNSGKSHLCKWILHKMLLQKIVGEIFIISQTEKISQSFGCFDKDHIKETYDPMWIAKLMKNQGDLIKKLGKDKAPTLTILLDDVIGTLRPGDESLAKNFTLGRHLNINLILLLQYSKRALAPTLRANIDYLFINRLPEDGMRIVYEMVHYSGPFKKFLEFVKSKQKDKPYLFMLFDSLTSEDSQRWKCVEAPGEVVDFQIKY